MDTPQDQLESAIPWHYTVRRSGRAKRIKLSFVESKGLELVLPQRASLREGEAFVRSQHAWIAALAQRHGLDLRRPPAVPAVPRRIELRACGESYAVLRGERTGLCERDGALWLKASAEQAPLLLQRWMLHKGKQVLLPWLQSCSASTGLSYRSAGVRNQSSRWGSYSSRGTVSLSCRLLLLSAEEVEYVLLHELCHSVHMNHSAAFWQLLESVCPGARVLDRAVDESAKAIPAWLRYRP